MVCPSSAFHVYTRCKLFKVHGFDQDSWMRDPNDAVTEAQSFTSMGRLLQRCHDETTDPAVDHALETIILCAGGAFQRVRVNLAQTVGLIICPFKGSA